MKTTGMSTLAVKGKLKVTMNHRLGKHKAPYIKVFYGDEDSANFTLDGELRVGNPPPKVIKEIQEYIKLNQDKLQLAWKHVLQGTRPGSVPFPKKKAEANILGIKPGLKITKIESLDNYWLMAEFSTGEKFYLDFKPFFKYGPIFSQIKPMFNKVKIDGNGEFFSWPNGLDLEASDFYELGVLKLPKVA